MNYKNRIPFSGKSIVSLSTRQIQAKKDIEDNIRNNIYILESVQCSICNGNSFETIAEQDRYGLRMTTKICHECGLVQTNPRMDQHSYNLFYQNDYRRLYDGTNKPTRSFFQAQYQRGRSLYNFLAKNGFLGNNPKETVIFEVGCAAGGVLLYFQNKGFSVCGIDLNKIHIEYGRKRYGLNLSEGQLESINLSRKPDIVIYSHVFEHILNPDRELDLLQGIIHNESLVLIEVPGIMNLSAYFYDFRLYLQNAHVYHYSLNSLNRIFKKAGFRLLLGTEDVRAVFKREKIKQSHEDEKTFSSEYNQIIEALNNAEKKKNCVKTRILLWISNICIIFLRRSNLYEFAKLVSRKLH